MKQVMKVEMFGRTIIIRQYPGKEYEFRVYEKISPYREHHLDSFESFEEAWEDVQYHLWKEPRCD